VCLVDDGDVRTVFFAETAGVPAQFALAGEPAPRTVAAGRAPALRVGGTDGAAVQIVLLGEADSLALWKGEWRGRERVFLTRAGLVLDGDQVRLTSREISDLRLGVFPAPAELAGGVPDGVFMQFVPPPPPRADFAASVIAIQAAEAAREVPLGRAPRPVAEQPSDADFARAAVWRIKLPDHLDLSTDPILRVHYVGDVARITLNGRLVTDDFYNGNAWEIGLRRHAPAVLQGDLRIAILPLRKDTVMGPGRKVYLADELLPDFGNAASVARLQSVEIIPRYQVAFPDRGTR
jgi:hypothetical protein